jgi:hypothetical protein
MPLGTLQYAAIVLLDDAVALARSFLQARPIKDDDAAALIIDDPGSLQETRRGGDAGTAHSKHR